MCGFFDIDSSLKGKKRRGIPIRMIDELPEFTKNTKVDIATLTIPKENADKMVEKLIGLGIKSIWNFALVDLEVPSDVIVENVHLSDSLMQLSYNIAKSK